MTPGLQAGSLPQPTLNDSCHAADESAKRRECMPAGSLSQPHCHHSWQRTGLLYTGAMTATSNKAPYEGFNCHIPFQSASKSQYQLQFLCTYNTPLPAAAPAATAAASCSATGDSENLHLMTCQLLAVVAAQQLPTPNASISTAHTPCPCRGPLVHTCRQRSRTKEPGQLVTPISMTPGV
jgi:hypothetical protein